MTLNLDRSTWTRVKFGDVARKVNAKVDPTSGEVERYVAGEHMDTDELRITRWGSVGDGYLGPAFHARFRPGQVLYGSRRTYLRKVALADFDGVCANTTFVIETKDPSVLLPELLPFVMTTESFHAHSKAESKGSVNPYINWPDIAKYEFDLPPLDEQKRMAELLWAVEHTRRTDCNLVSCAQSLIRCFCEQLAANPGWPSLTISDVGAKGEQPVQVGPFGGSLASRHFTAAGARVIKIQNIGANGEWLLEPSVFVSREYAENFARYAVAEGDVAISAQASVGRVAVVSDELAGALISQHLIRVRLDTQRVRPEFLALLLRSSNGQAQMAAVKTKTTRDGLNTEDVERFHFRLPPVDQQDALLAVVAQLQSCAAQASTALAASVRLCGGLLAPLLGTAP